MRERDAQRLLRALLLWAVPLAAWRAFDRPAPLGPERPALPCAVPVEVKGEGVGCLIAAPPGVRAGDRLGPHGQPRGPGHERMAPARLAALGAPIDLNRGSLAELASLDGIGPRLAERIARARPFRAVEELAHVPGVGAKRLALLRDRLVVEPAD